MKWTLIYCFFIALLFGCKDEELMPSQHLINKTLLEQNVWINQQEIEEQYTDQMNPIIYLKSTTISFTPSHYSHKIESKLHDKVTKNTPELENLDIWGTYQISGVDSVITLFYTNHLVAKDNQSATLEDYSPLALKYKIIKLNANELTLKHVVDSSFSEYQPEITFRPLKNTEVIK